MHMPSHGLIQHCARIHAPAHGNKWRRCGHAQARHPGKALDVSYFDQPVLLSLGSVLNLVRKVVLGAVEGAFPEKFAEHHAGSAECTHKEPPLDRGEKCHLHVVFEKGEEHGEAEGALVG